MAASFMLQLVYSSAAFSGTHAALGSKICYKDHRNKCFTKMCAAIIALILRKMPESFMPCKKYMDACIPRWPLFIYAMYTARVY